MRVDTDQQGTGIKSQCSLDKHSLSSPGAVIWECLNTVDWYQYGDTDSHGNDSSVTEGHKFFLKLNLYWQKDPLIYVCL